MQADKAKNMKKIQRAFDKLDKRTKHVLNIGSLLSLIVLMAGGILFLLNRTVYGYDTYIELISTSIIKASVTILAEVFIGALLIDYLLGSKGWFVPVNHRSFFFAHNPKTKVWQKEAYFNWHQNHSTKKYTFKCKFF